MHHFGNLSGENFLKIMEVCNKVLNYDFAIFGTHVTLYKLLLFSILLFNLLYLYMNLFQDN